MFEILRDTVKNGKKFSVIATEWEGEKYLSVTKTDPKDKFIQPFHGLVSIFAGILAIITPILLSAYVYGVFSVLEVITVPLALVCFVAGGMFFSRRACFDGQRNELYVNELFNINASISFDEFSRYVKAYLHSMNEEQFYDMILNAHKLEELDNKKKPLENALKTYTNDNDLYKEAKNRVEEISKEITERSSIKKNHLCSVTEMKESLNLMAALENANKID